MEGQIDDEDRVGVALADDGVAQDLTRVHVVTGEELAAPELDHASRRPLEVLLGRVSPHGAEQLLDGGGHGLSSVHNEAVCYPDSMQVKGKLAVVTGGARRVGAAIVEALAAAGARPLVHYHRSRDAAEALAARFDGVAIGADLARPDGAAALCRGVAEVQGELAVWVNSAAALEQASFMESDDALWARTLQLTLLSPVSCCRAAAGRMVEGGVIINVLDVAAHQPWKGFAHHCVAKAGLLMLTRALAVELAPRLRVCGVTPGLVTPDEGSPWTGLARRVPLGREGSPTDVGQAVRFLVEADYVTGSVVTVDGGLTSRSL